MFQTTKIDEDMPAKTGTEKDPKVENEINCARREQEGKEEAKKRQKKVRANPHVPATTVASVGRQAEAVINKTFCTQSRDSQQLET